MKPIRRRIVKPAIMPRDIGTEPLTPGLRPRDLDQEPTVAYGFHADFISDEGSDDGEAD